MHKLDTLFKFPTVMIDGNNEERKEKLALEEDVDVIIGYVECPYDDFIAIADRWLPNEESFKNALNGKFDACEVIFGQSGAHVVPWPREKFLSKLRDFIAKLPPFPEIKATVITSQKLKQFLDGEDNQPD